uniref:Uncharacterized protein n=1 Tax=Rhizobium phage IG49 TaxID=3129228 RepID=A0AAU8HYN5_9CAUD
MISIFLEDENKYYAIAACITWFTNEPEKVKVYKDENCAAFRFDKGVLERSSLYRDRWSVVPVPDVASKNKVFEERY